MYLPLNQLFQEFYVAPLNKFGCVICWLLAVISHVLGIIFWLTAADLPTDFLYLYGWILVFLGIFVAIPGALFPATCLAPPCALAIHGIINNQKVWHHVWFWVVTVGCCIAFCFATKWFFDRYSKKKIDKTTYDNSQRHGWRW